MLVYYNTLYTSVDVYITNVNIMMHEQNADIANYSVLSFNKYAHIYIYTFVSLHFYFSRFIIIIFIFPSK